MSGTSLFFEAIRLFIQFKSIGRAGFSNPRTAFHISFLAVFWLDTL